MPQPNRPLANIFVSSRSDRLNTPVQALTPRTPHSRHGRAEEGFTEIELDDLSEGDEEEEDPFLTAGQPPPPSVSPGPASTSFPPGYRSRGDDHEVVGPKLRMCPSSLMIAERLIYLSGAFFVFGIFALFFMAFQRDMEDNGLGLVINYRHYYIFPLTGAQYAHECEKISWFKEGPAYWDVPLSGPLDVVHHDRRLWMHGHSPICSSTVTYQLDGHAGLATDLALLAQIAALARERNSTLFIDDTYWNRGRWVDYSRTSAISTQVRSPDVRDHRQKSSWRVLEAQGEQPYFCHSSYDDRPVRHWVVNSHTAKYHLNAQFSETYEDRNRIHPVAAARSHSGTSLHRVQLVHDITLAQHNHPSLKEYVQAVHDTWTRLYPNHPISLDAAPAPTPGIPRRADVVRGDGRPETLRSYVAAFPPSAAKFALDLSTNAELRALAPSTRTTPLTRGMIVDLALMSGLWAEEGYVVPGGRYALLVRMHANSPPSV
ncbi:uncharacterized protein B0H18DRAFT_1117336 [Fomitopsis serialis]|uniref:uncharacterized protein n=1 Tax=Fomitopsis serialis TaxID=139415 RepID=UPI0020071EA9|nr:uncharacterized protein B0H18DRAFT_1117336 [Neoantrodia serialis]KAH9929803.1 hypothetical protein B0H18DRAFT_1117336 [Neoantrodia serialis]